MKKELTIYIFLIAAIVSLSVIDPNMYWNNVVKTQDLDISKFGSICIDLPAEVYITQGNNNKIVIEAPNRYLKDIQQNINGKSSITLHASPESAMGSLAANVHEQDEIRIFVNASCLNKVKVTERAEIISSEYCANQIKIMAKDSPEDQKKLLHLNIGSLIQSLGTIYVL